jgi:sec-independent protein translocase protein TatC
MNTQNEMTLFEHLGELRKRLLYSFIAITLCSVACFSYTGEIFYLLSEPYLESFKNNLLIGTGPAEAFILRVKVALFAGIVFSSPIIFIQFWLFVAPGLLENERKWFIPFVIAATLLFLTGVAFCFSVVLPLTFTFFAEQYQLISITPTIRISEHLSMMIHALVGFGLVFEMPVVALLLGRIGIITHRTLIDGGRYAILIIFIVSAILTPPDVLTQFLMAIPLLILYIISIGIVWAVERDTSSKPNELE